MNQQDIRRVTPQETIALLEETLEATHDGLLVLDLDRRVVRYNQQFIRMFGLTADDLDREGMDAVAAALSTQVEDAGRLLVNLADPSIEVLDTLRFKDGRVFERFIAPHRIAGRIIGRVASYRDVTNTVRAEQALETQRAVLEKAQEVAHIGSWVAEFNDADSLEWSKETYRIFGVERARFGGTSSDFFALVHPDDVDAVRRASNASRGGECAYEIEHRIVRGDGTVRWVHEKADIIRDAEGHPVRMVGTVQDVTDKRQLEEQLRQSQKLEAIGRLAGGIAHDLNNSLTAIIGFTELALGALETGDPARPDVQEIRRAAGRAASVTRQLLAFSRKQMLEPRVFSLAESVANTGRMSERIVGPSITLRTMPRPVPPIYGDPGQIEQAILNIVVNARDAMPGGGALTMSVADVHADEAFALQNPPMPIGRYVELRVTDTGSGMDADTKARVFEPFFTTKEVGKGTGLGLAMVYGTVRQSGGYIFVDSEPGAGSTFRLYFPSAEDRPDEPVRRSGANASTGTVLVVDDEAPIRTIAVTALRRKGHRVLQAASGEEALGLALAETRPIDVLLTDASMPGMGGIELAKTLSAERPDMLIVVMSGFTEKSLALKDAGVEAILLPKPFSPSELQRTIADVLAGRSTGRS